MKFEVQSSVLQTLPCHLLSSTAVHGCQSCSRFHVEYLIIFSESSHGKKDLQRALDTPRAQLTLAFDLTGVSSPSNSPG